MLKRGFLALTLIVCAIDATAAACTGAPSDCTEVRFTVDGRPRLYEYHVPQGASCGATNLPVVMFLHGGGGTAMQSRNATGYGSSDRNCFVHVWPEGVRFEANSALWNPGDCVGVPPASGYTGPVTPPGCGFNTTQTSIDDVNYFRRLLDDLATRVSIDARRVYAGGWSHGGGMSHRLACELSDRITAIAPMEGTMKLATCAPPRAVPVIVWAALGDHNSPYGGGERDTSVPYSIAMHLAHAQLPPFSQPTTSYVVPSTIDASWTDSVREWRGGRDGSVVVLHTLSAQLDHGWLNEKPPAFDWQELNWAFFRQFALPAPAGSGRMRSVRH